MISDLALHVLWSPVISLNSQEMIKECCISMGEKHLYKLERVLQSKNCFTAAVHSLFKAESQWDSGVPCPEDSLHS